MLRTHTNCTALANVFRSAKPRNTTGSNTAANTGTRARQQRRAHTSTHEQRREKKRTPRPPVHSTH